MNAIVKEWIAKAEEAIEAIKAVRVLVRERLESR